MKLRLVRDKKIKIRRTVNARNTDPLTSHLGARDVEPRAVSQSHALLRAFNRYPDGLIDEQAAAVADLLHTGYWKRCSDLRNKGFIAPVYVPGQGHPLTREAMSGSEAQISRITDLGRLELELHEASALIRDKHKETA